MGDHLYQVSVGLELAKRKGNFAPSRLAGRTRIGTTSLRGKEDGLVRPSSWPPGAASHF